MMVDTVLGLSRFVSHCHSLDNSVAIPKDFRVTCVHCSQLWQAQLFIASQAMCTAFVASAC